MPRYCRWTIRISLILQNRLKGAAHNQDIDGNRPVRDAEVALSADDIDEEEGNGCEQDNLQDRVDDDNDGAGRDVASVTG